MMQPIAWCVTSTLRSAALFAIFFRADDIRCTDHPALAPVSFQAALTLSLSRYE